jgi:cytochrome b involved in lipid metabolism
VIAEQSGEALEARVGSPGQHAEWGEMLPPLAIALFVLSVIWVILLRMSSSRGKIIAALVGAGVIVIGTLAIVFTVLTGHSGAEQTWSDRVEDSAITTEPDDVVVAPVEAEVPAEATMGDVLSIETVAANDSEASCWAIIEGNVYDLTDWISQHPGGSSRIVSLCGTDGTSQFTRQHGGQGSAESALEGYLIGQLGDPLP